MLNKNELLKIAIEKVESVGIPYSNKIYPILEVNTRAKKRWGQCRYDKGIGKYIIQINSLLLADGKEEEAISTLIHEVLHTCEGCMNHKTKWKNYANIINNKLGYDITRTTSYEAVGIERPKPKYLVKCKNCGMEIHRHKKSRLIEDTKQYRCGKCKGKLERIY